MLCDMCLIPFIFLETERAALNAGTVGFDRNIFSGNPTLADLKNYSVKASPDEQGNRYIKIYFNGG